jgi:hypothetical protein
MNPLLISTAVVFSMYSVAAWVRDRVAPADKTGKSQPAVTSTGENRRQAMQLCAA